MIYFVGLLLTFLGLCLLDAHVESSKGDLSTSLIVLFSLVWFISVPVMFLFVLYLVCERVHKAIKIFFKKDENNACNPK